MRVENLDQLCARYGYEIANSTRDENHITKSLGVLQEDGVYAFFLYQESKRKKTVNDKDSKNADVKKEGLKSGAAQNSGKTNDPASELSSRCAQMLRDPTISLLPNGNDIFEPVRMLAGNLNNLLLGKRLLEQTLIYARYHAKALEPAK
jgi:NADPH:quinone reductase-like Zn-dependent oxidoreductase